VELCVRDEIMKRHGAEIEEVAGVTVHYVDTLLVNVDVDLRIGSFSTVWAANQIAGRVRDTLERSDQISKANIFLDLNANVASTEVPVNGGSR
jgi:hypothetical protein